MKLNKYQKEAVKTAFFTGDGLVYCTLGLTGESGEFADHVKKMLRDDNGELSKERKELLIKELGDVLWYIANLADSLNTDLDTVAKTNLDKLHKRINKGTQRGSGDNR
jgi:NTP pyrophosphatase (non-canonical NTP hydrolase)